MDIHSPTLDLLSSIVNSAPVPIGVYKGDNLQIILANKCMIDTYGKGDDVVGKSYLQILPELREQGVFEQLLNVLKTAEPFHAVNRRVDLEIAGELRTHYFNYDFTPVFDRQGEVYAVMNTAMDVTPLYTAQKEIADAQEKLRLAVDSADLGIFEIDYVTGVAKASERFADIWGLEPSKIYHHEDLLGRIYLLDKEIREHAFELAHETKHLTYEVRIVHEDDSLHWIRVRGTFITDDDGQIRCVLGIVQDITEHKLFAEGLRKMVKKRTKDLKRSNEDLLQFAHVVSHDLKEPVRKIKVYNEMLKSELEPILPERGRRYIDKVQNASDRIYMMIDGILNYSAINRTGTPTEVVNLNTVLENIKTDLELLIEQKKAVITYDPMPEIEGSPILIHQLFFNLLTNALKFSKEDVPPRILVKCACTDKEVKILVTDNGIGVAEQYLKQIFNTFERLHSKNKYEGTGLGLSLCKKIVQRHHGTIEAISNTAELGGTEFRIMLPVVQPIKKTAGNFETAQ